MYDSEFISLSMLPGLFVCHSSAPQIEGLSEQCKILMSACSNTKQDHPAEILRLKECS